MSSENMKIVEFHEYCNKCKHKSVGESEKPCYECLHEAARQYSHKPARFEAK